MRVRALLTAGAALIALAALVACSGPAAMPTPPPGAVVIGADHDVFLAATYSAPAGTPFTIFFENREASQHNVRVWNPANVSVAETEVFSGPAARTVDVAALEPGSYRLTCDIHSNMVAQLVVE